MAYGQTTKKKVPAGYHMMPNGKLMKGSSHKIKTPNKKKSKNNGKRS